MSTKSEQRRAEEQQQEREQQRERRAATAREAQAVKRPARKAKTRTYELELSPGRRPPRKSTRRSPTHQKTDNGLRLKAVDRNASPATRAARR
ncbi:MAG TPA: hypothetical protein VGP07_24830 [Polyangia bacterium]|jgi:hypothetical protein